MPENYRILGRIFSVSCYENVYVLDLMALKAEISTHFVYKFPEKIQNFSKIIEISATRQIGKVFQLLAKVIKLRDSMVKRKQSSILPIFKAEFSR